MKLLLIVAVLHIFLFDSHTTRVLNARATDTLTTVNIFGIRKTIKIETITISNESEEVDIEFATIPAGGFAMGSSDGDTKEKPAHRVRISKPFKISTKEVTQRLWYMVMKNLPYPYNFQKRERSCIDYNEQTNVCPHNPINFVSWYHIREFIQRLNILTNGNYRLPTEAEWEYAARADTITTYFWGDDSDKLSDYAWYGKPYGGIRPVGTKKPNPWGLYDIYGNVWEWVQDNYSKYPESQVIDPVTSTTGGLFVLRGGGWCFYFNINRPYVNNTSLRKSPISQTSKRPSSTVRISLWGHVIQGDIGFRLVSQ